MQKNYFHYDEVKFKDGTFVVEFEDEKKLTAQLEEEKLKLELQNQESYSGPTLEMLKQEAEDFKKQWSIEKQELIENSKVEAQFIIDDAKEKAEAILEEAKLESQNSKEELLKYQEAMKEESESKYKAIIDNANSQVELIRQKAHEEGFLAGEKEGFQSGVKECDRLVDRLHAIINKMIEKRADIITESEGQVIDLILSISKKVVKVIASNNKEVIVENALEALDKLKSKSNVIIRANFADIKILQDKREDLIKNIEKLENVEFLEDTSVEVGGCIVETDFGEVDARISSQLLEIERKIMEVVPVKSKGSKFRFK